MFAVRCEVLTSPMEEVFPLLLSLLFHYCLFYKTAGHNMRDVASTVSFMFDMY